MFRKRLGTPRMLKQYNVEVVIQDGDKYVCDIVVNKDGTLHSGGGNDYPAELVQAAIEGALLVKSKVEKEEDA